VGVLAAIEDNQMRMRAQLFRNEATAPREGEVKGAYDDGEELATKLLRRIQEE
jgi:porphobilinogen deaminase